MSPQWGVVDGAKGYLVELATGLAFKHRVVLERVTAPEWVVHDLEPGVYYLRVAGIDDEGQVGPFSEPSRVVLTKTAAPEPRKRRPVGSPELLAPVDGEKVMLAALLPVVSFPRREAKGAATYVIQVANDPEFRELPFEKKTRGLGVGVELRPTTYCWRMKSLRSPDDGGSLEPDQSLRSHPHLARKAERRPAADRTAPRGDRLVAEAQAGARPSEPRLRTNELPL